MKEIGSEYWDAPVAEKANGIFPEQTQWFLSGRHALRAIVQDLPKIESIALPSWCCDSMIKPFVDAGIKVRFYPVFYKDGFSQKFDRNCDALFVMDYFGYVPEPIIHDNYTGIIIRDVTHSIFSSPNKDADYYFGSLRKWCGVWTGGFAWGEKLKTPRITNDEYVSLRQLAMEEKCRYITHAVGSKENYLSIFAHAEEMLDNEGLFAGDPNDIEAAKHLDIASIKYQRRENARILMEAFPEMLIFGKLHEDDCPLFVPIRLPHDLRNKLRAHLIERSIYCPIHWPLTQLHNVTTAEAMLYDEELSLVCDQRYNIEDMFRLVDEIMCFMRRADCAHGF